MHPLMRIILGKGGGGGVVLPPVADFTSEPPTFLTLNEGQTVDFIDLSTNSPTSWVWLARNSGIAGPLSTAQNPTVTWAQIIAINGPGVYDIILQATNAAGSDTKTVVAYLGVNAAPTSPLTFDGATSTTFYTGTKTNIVFECWGGGAAGDDTTGGGGGEYRTTAYVGPGNTIMDIGIVDGGPSSVSEISLGVLCSASGANGSAGGSGGTGDSGDSGGNGGVIVGGGGGCGRGAAGNGDNGVIGISAGSGGIGGNGGGNGGNGSLLSDGDSGNAPGGGGGASAIANPGAGAAGRITITWS